MYQAAENFWLLSKLRKKKKHSSVAKIEAAHQTSKPKATSI